MIDEVAVYNIAKHCLRVNAEVDVCEDCVMHGRCDHTAIEDNARILLSKLEKLEKYEQLEEKGLLPRFHMGDEFYVNVIWRNQTLKAKVVMIQQKKDKTWKYRLCDEYASTSDFTESEYGIKFFATEKDAQDALAKQKASGKDK